ncbi:hypothetical protein GGH12_003452 [Coemansia sp. RSA 1822]|nr:hypothetical protein LPJ76_003245 [Coemansia sp. RSA 638]KAJ2120711.1 hypothetical protein IW147_004850 [Coemansia sp. RSA 720]KAJ2542019.1 hypothetical protein GGF49_003218 [Coemansia sp. RSA 1853]KAJ2562149.1 hypothetical protein GGH12_003452 [Coemansia sp. RSA 1822]
MSRFWNRNRRNVVLAVSAAMVGLLGYLAYEVYVESTKDYIDDENDDTQSENSDVEDIIHINLPADDTTLADTDTFRQPASKPAEKRQSLVISARGVVFDSACDDKWSSDIRMHPDAVSHLSHLSELYDVYLLVVVHSGAEESIVRSLEQSGVLTQSAAMDVGKSVVWVDRDDTAQSNVSLASNSPGVLARSHILFCQTEEGKVHMARHLLTAVPGVSGKSSIGYAGYVDTNHDVVARLSQVLHTAVLVAPTVGSHSVIDHGDVPGSHTMFSTPDPSEPSSSNHLSLGPSVEIVETLAQSSLYR